MTKMTDAFKKIFLGLGGDPKELAENNDVGDYILDLEDAIKKTASNVIDDSEASDITTYSSNKITSLIPSGEYLMVSTIRMNMSDPLEFTFPDSYSREMFLKITGKMPSILYVAQFMMDDNYKFTGGVYCPLMAASSNYVIYRGIGDAYDNVVLKHYELFFKIDKNNASKDAFWFKEFEIPTT